MLCLTIADLNKLAPCSHDGRRVRALLRKFNPDKAHCFTAAEARDAGCTFDDIAWVSSAVGRNNPAIDRRIRLFLNDCAIRVLRVFEMRFPNDERPRRAIEATAAWGRAETDEAAEAARAAGAAWAARAAGAAEAARAAGAAEAAEAARAAEAAWAARAAEAAWAAWAARAAGAARAAEAAEAAWAAEKDWQFDRLIAWLSADEPEPLAIPAKAALAEQAA